MCLTYIVWLGGGFMQCILPQNNTLYCMWLQYNINSQLQASIKLRAMRKESGLNISNKAWSLRHHYRINTREKVCLATYLILDDMVAADQGCGFSAWLFSREVGIWKATCGRKKCIGWIGNDESIKKTCSHTVCFIIKKIYSIMNSITLKNVIKC